MTISSMPTTWDKWEADYGNTVVDAGSDADGNSNAIVDGGDFLLWQRIFSGSSGSTQAASHAVPEPSTAVLLTVVCGAQLMLLQRRNRDGFFSPAQG